MADILFILLRYFIRKSPFFLDYLFTLQCQCRYSDGCCNITQEQHREAGVVGGEENADLHEIFIAVYDTHFYVHKI